MGTMYPLPRFEDYADEMRRQAMLNAQQNPNQSLIWNRNTDAPVEHGSTVSELSPSTVEVPAADPAPPSKATDNDDWFDLALVVVLVAFALAMTFFQRLT